MLFSFDEHRAESFALRVAELFTAKPLTAGARAAAFSGHVIPYADRTGTVLIGSWARQPAHNVSALDVLDGRTQQSDFRNKIVLVGQSNDAARDREFTPMFRLAPADAGRLRLPGIQIHAAAIATLLDGTAVRPTPKPFVLAVNFGLSCLAVYLLMRWQLRYSLLGVTLLVLAAYGFSQLLFTSSHVWFPYLSTQISILLIVPLTLAYQFVLERGQGTELMNLFTRYMAPEVAREIWRRRNEVTLAGEERIATVLFSDIRSFTEMTAGKPSQLVLAWLNNYFTEMEQVITEERGFLNKYIGDGLMVLFGVPLSDGPEQDAARAVRTALRMLERVEELNRTRPANSDFPCFRIGIGIHTGRLTAGSIGSQKRLEFSAIGDSVNLASRCESLNKEFKSEIIITEATYQLVKDQFTGIRDLGEAQVRGFRDKIRMYTIQTKQSEGRTETDEEGQSVPHLSVSTSGPDSHGPEHNAVKSI
jgi:class 3 adenylate cyclase